MYIILQCPEVTITISVLLSPLYTTTTNLPPVLQMTSFLIFLVSLLCCPTLTREGGTSLVSPAQHLHHMVSCIMAIFSCYLYSRYFRSQYSWLSAGATSPTWRSDPWWYHATIATFNLESCCWCRSFCSPCIVWGKQCHTSKYFFLIVHALLIYIFRVPEEQLTFWRTATQSVLLTDSPPPQPRLKAILRRLLAALQHLPLLLRGLWHGQPHLERDGGLGQRGLTK
jgi:hypothetical protein